MYSSDPNRLAAVLKAPFPAAFPGGIGWEIVSVSQPKGVNCETLETTAMVLLWWRSLDILAQLRLELSKIRPVLDDLQGGFAHEFLEILEAIPEGLLKGCDSLLGIRFVQQPLCQRQEPIARGCLRAETELARNPEQSARILANQFTPFPRVGGCRSVATHMELIATAEGIDELLDLLPLLLHQQPPRSSAHISKQLLHLRCESMLIQQDIDQIAL